MAKAKPKTLEVGINGSATIHDNMKLDEKVWLLVQGTVSHVGTKATATKGHVDIRRVKADDIMLLPEAVKDSTISAAIAERDARDGVVALPMDDWSDDETA